jgi:hypothetical protein
MKTQINEVKRMQLLAGIINEDLRKGVYNDFNKWKESFPEGTEFKQENGYMMAKDPQDKELGKWNPSSMIGMYADDFQYKSLEEEINLDEIVDKVLAKVRNTK